MINIQQFDHIGIRITKRRRSVLFYETLGFKITFEPDFDDVIVMKNDNGVEINLVINVVDLNNNKNILGMMPHPERLIDPILSGEDGSLMFESLFNSLI